MATQREDPLLGQLIAGKYRVVQGIARGGMGRIYQGVQEPLGRPVAIKVLDVPGMDAHNRETFEKRFFLEASISSRLSHPNTVTIHDFGKLEHSDGLYIVMEFMKGRTLRKAIAEDGAFAVPRALHVAKQICRSLREAHEAGVIHRDLKPSNIFLIEGGDEGDAVKVFDFGLVKQLGGDAEHDLTASGAMLGTPRYMSPEQILAVDVDARTDIYSLGVILYEMLAGVPPFKSKSKDAAQIDLIMAQLHNPPPPLASTPAGARASGALERVVMKCLAKEPENRFGSMAEVLGALKAIEAGHGDVMTQDIDPTPSSVVRLEEARRLRSAPLPADVPTLIARAKAGEVEEVAANTLLTPQPPATHRRSAAPVVAVLVLLAVGGALGWGLWQRSLPAADAPADPALTTDAGRPARVPDAAVGAVASLRDAGAAAADAAGSGPDASKPVRRPPRRPPHKPVAPGDDDIKVTR